jgi:hypothetical protein
MQFHLPHSLSECHNHNVKFIAVGRTKNSLSYIMHDVLHLLHAVCIQYVTELCVDIEAIQFSDSHLITLANER